MSKRIKEACRSELWTQTKMNDFWEMRKNLGGSCTTIGFQIPSSLPPMGPIPT